MRKLSILVVFLCATALSAMAQYDLPKYEVFAGYSWFRMDATSFNYTGHASFQGGEVSATRYFGDNLGLKLDVGGYAGKPKALEQYSTKTFSFMAGPVYAFRRDEKLSAYVHGMVGIVKFSIGDNQDYSDRSIAEAVGGGIDYNMTDHWTVRVAQIDYMHTDYLNENQHHVRASAGLVYRF